MKRRQMIFGIGVVAILVALFTWSFSRGRQSTPTSQSQSTTSSQTVTASTSPADLIVSRQFRAFSGFLMGSVNTWRTFENALDYFYYFNPMSGNVGTPAKEFANIVKEKQKDFFIYAASGTDDFAYTAFKEQVLSLARRVPSIFKMEENVIFRLRQGGRHDYQAVCDYTYNALVNIF